MSYIHAERLLSLETPLGSDVLLLEGLTGQETLSGLFNFTLYLLSENTAVPFGAVVGKPATVQINHPNGSVRYINGIISQFAQGPIENRFVRYHAILVPWLWNLTQAADCRIFQNKTVPDIIQAVFQERGFSDFKLKLSQNYQPREYCVQYRETDFEFVSRLMEEEAIFYFFEHAHGQHTLILGDAPSVHQACPGQSRLPYSSYGGPQGMDSVSAWLEEQEIRTAKYALTDYNFETPSTNLAVNLPTLLAVGRNDKLEIYDYPGKYRKTSEGERYVKFRMEEQETPHLRISGASDCRSLTAGYLFNLSDHYRADSNGAYLLTSVAHQAVSNLLTGGSGASYSNTFTCIPEKTLYRPARITPKPVVMGPQTAVVVGPQGEEIYTDKYGRVKVQFHWDRQGKKNEKSSCWIRVAQVWAGKNWGGMHIPRIGQEVIVDFLEGDPDQPIITGRVYNAGSMPPYELPGNATMTTLKSNSSKGGDGFNEIRFEDKKGQEQIFIHGEKNQDVRIKNDVYEWVGNDTHLLVKKDQLEQIDGDKHLTVKGDHNQKINGTVSIDASMDMQEKVGMKHALDAGMEIHLKAGMNVVIEAGMSITLKAGGGFVVVGPAGVTMVGTPVLINSGGSAGSGSGCSPEVPKPPKEAAKADPGSVNEAPVASPATSSRSSSTAPAGGFSNPQAQTLANAAQSGAPFCEKCNS